MGKGEDDAEDTAPLLEPTKSKPHKPPMAGLKVDVDTWMKLSQIAWIALFSASAAALTWWIPQTFIRGLNLTAFVCNIIGSAIMAATTTFEQVRFESPQTYAVYKAVKFGLCAVLTNFSILIEDSERLLHTSNWWLSPLNLIMNVGFAMIAYQIGRLGALRVKAGAEFSMALLLMENEERRMRAELDAHAAAERQLKGEVEEEHVTQEWDAQVISHIHSAKLKMARKNSSPWLSARHMLLLALLVALPLVNCLILTYHDNESQIESANQQYDYSMSIVMSVLGALAARHYGTQKVNRTDVQWKTFRVNMASCILIATAHNVLFFRNFFPSLSHENVILFLKRFVQCFCGCLSSFAELIDETVVLINSTSCPREIVFRNIFYNLLLCLAAFFFVVYLASGIVSLIWTIPL